jgi:type VI secretion system protein ImpI
MALTLTIENETSLPDGGPLSVRVTGKRGIDMGRDTHLDWTLPDPSRTISGKHCEVRYRDGAYWLYDVSTNGTFLYGEEGRLKAPHRLRNGDRLLIGQYIIAVTVEGELAAAPADAAGASSQPSNFWSDLPGAPHAVSASELRTPREEARPINPDFLDWAADVPELDDLQAAPSTSSSPAPHSMPRADNAWAAGKPNVALPPDPPPARPAPRRPIWIANDPSGPWAGGSPAEHAEAGRPAAQERRESGPGPAAQPAAHAPPSDFVNLLARGAGVPPEVFSQLRPDELAHLLGALLRVVTENMRQLLAARQQAKRMARTHDQTTVQAIDNNPLKFSPTTEDALRIMFGAAMPSYLDARRALEQAFDDLKTHQIKTYSGMQQALVMLIEDLDPEAIDRDTHPDKGISALVTSRKAKLWDAYVVRWQAKERRSEGGLVGVFMDYFAESYDGLKRMR